MKSAPLSRRSMLSLLGTGVVVAPSVARASTSSGAAGAIAVELPAGAAAPSVHPILSPLRVGARVAGCRIESIAAPAHGAIGLHLVDTAGQAFGLEVCARDPQVAAPGEARHHQVFVVNEGDGSQPTHEEHGLAAMTVAALVADNEGDGPAPGMLPLQERLALHGAAITRPA
jgi:hypothetical protein